MKENIEDVLSYAIDTPVYGVCLLTQTDANELQAKLRRLAAENAELLEFARSVVRYAGNSCDDYIADQARAAIAKATGEMK